MRNSMQHSVLIVVACLCVACDSGRQAERQLKTQYRETSMEAQIRTIVAKQLGVNETDVNPDRTFAELGADDLDVVEITLMVEDEFGIVIRDESLMSAAGLSNPSSIDSLCANLTLRRFMDVAHSSQKQRPQDAQTEDTDEKILRESQVGLYRELSKLSNPNGLVLVFIPSLEQLTKLKEHRLGRKMNSDEIEAMRQSAAVIALPKEVADRMKTMGSACP